jgi:AcrR family transcriptional regulator
MDNQQEEPYVESAGHSQREQEKAYQNHQGKTQGQTGKKETGTIDRDLPDPGWRSTAPAQRPLRKEWRLIRPGSGRFTKAGTFPMTAKNKDRSRQDAFRHPSAKKRDSILATALKLFNANGSHKVTTNHIAREMGISPGNLYYHFKNKEHIIRELLVRLIDGFDSLVRIEGEAASGIDIIVATLDATAELIHTYRFIYIELAALLSRDDDFKAMYHDIKERRAREFALLFGLVDGMGVFRQTITPEERDAVIFIIWTYAEGIITALHTSNIPVTTASIKIHFKKIAYFLKAYLQPAIWRELSQKLGLK